MRWRMLIFALAACCLPGAAVGEWSGQVTGEGQVFPSAPRDDAQHRTDLSLSFQPEYYHEWEKRNESLQFVPFFRWDQRDSARTHADIRELLWQKAAPNWELRLGISRVYWGVTESKHLVDIINPIDTAEQARGREKLGQLMLNFAWIRDWGTLDFFILPGTRQPTFPGDGGRPKSPIRIELDDAEYESGAEEWHTDWAVRWSHSAGAWDIGLSHFAGTSREPRWLPNLMGFDASGIYDSLANSSTGPFQSAVNGILGYYGMIASGTQWLAPFLHKLGTDTGWVLDLPGLTLVPYYDQIDQTGLDVQLTKGNWLWKLEAIRRCGQGKPFTAVTGGCEYTFYQVFESKIDVGLLAEWIYDNRQSGILRNSSNDLFLGTRVSFNDTHGTSVMAGGIVDPETGALAMGLQASRRLGQNWKLSVKSTVLVGVPPEDILTYFRKDDTVQAELTWYF